MVITDIFFINQEETEIVIESIDINPVLTTWPCPPKYKVPVMQWIKEGGVIKPYVPPPVPGWNSFEKELCSSDLWQRMLDAGFDLNELQEAIIEKKIVEVREEFIWIGHHGFFTAEDKVYVNDLTAKNGIEPVFL